MTPIDADELARAVRAGKIPEGGQLAEWVGIERAIELYAQARERGNIEQPYAGPRRRDPQRATPVIVSPQTRTTILADLERRAREHVETGGPLHGKFTDTAVTASRAGVWPDTATRTPNHLGYRLGDTIDDPTLIGTWHSHRDGATTPSNEDLIDAAETLRDLDTRRGVLLIAAYDGHAALARGRYDLAAYIVERLPTGDAFYEAAALR